MTPAMAYRISEYDELIQKCIDTYAVFYGSVSFTVCGDVVEVYAPEENKRGIQ